MPDPVDSLDAPIDWRDPALWPILSDLQGNILKGHGRDHTQNIFLRFDPDRVADVRKAIRRVAANVTSALTQLRETSVYKIVGRPGGTAVYLAISAAGYRAIGLTPPGNPAFLDGMAARAVDLQDPDEAKWEEHLRGIHAVLIVADDSDTLVANSAALLTAGLAEAGITVLGRDAGRAVRRAADRCACKGEGGAHFFGHVEGRHQPLLIAEDVAVERARDRSFKWDPGFSPRACALVRDPHGAFGESFGSYLVYRKLEQNAAALEARETALADVSGLAGQDRERAIYPCDHAADAAGLRCSCPSDAGEAGPRDDTERRLGMSAATVRLRPMPRRGIAYANLPDREGARAAPGAGLLFMAYNADIGRQFEFIQKSWVNNPTLIDDAFAGPPDRAPQPQSWWASKDAPPGRPIPFVIADFVTLKGGEYLFAPSLSALAAL